MKMIFVVMENEKMDDSINRRAAINVLEERLKANGYSNATLVSELNRSIGYLMRLPSADVAQIVRCKDCKYWNDAPAADGFNSCEMDALIRHESFFCANGERRDGEENES